MSYMTMTIDDVNNDDDNGYDVTTTITMWLLIMNRKSDNIHVNIYFTFCTI